MKVRGGNTCCTPSNARAHGSYKRSSDGQVIKRYCCKVCKTTYSAATLSLLKWQKKRHINHPLMELLSNNINLNAAARILRVNPKTVAKKLRFLGSMCQEMNMNNCQNYSQINDIQFDELQTIEHTNVSPCRLQWRLVKKNEKYLGLSYPACQQRGIWRRYLVKNMAKDRMIGLKE